MWFFDPSQWVRHHLFKDASIWEIPLVKPRFGCMLDLSRAALGYDMGLALRKTLEHFKGTTTKTTDGPTDRRAASNHFSSPFFILVMCVVRVLVKYVYGLLLAGKKKKVGLCMRGAGSRCPVVPDLTRKRDCCKRGNRKSPQLFPGKNK